MSTSTPLLGQETYGATQAKKEPEQAEQAPSIKLTRRVVACVAAGAMLLAIGFVAGASTSGATHESKRSRVAFTTSSGPSS